MTLPAIQKTWTITANNRVPFTTLNAATANALFGIKQFLKANGYTVRGSSNGTTAPTANTLITDGVDRWTTAADATTRGATSTAAQSWIILTDGNGVDILLAYQGSTDDLIVLAYSVGNLWTTAATATFQPTATDSLVVSSGSSFIGNSSIISDRIWFGWVDSQRKLCRFAFASGGTWVGSPWVIEIFTPETTAPGSIAANIWGFFVSATSASILNGTTVGAARKITGSVAASQANSGVVFSMEWTGLNSNNLSTIKPELQGATGYTAYALGIASNFTSYNGKLGALIDWYQGRTNADPGAVYGNKQWISMGGVNGSGTINAGMWPWDGTTDPLLT